MTKTSRWFGSALLVSSLTGVLLAQAPALDVRMGLWETTSTMQMAGDIPGVDTSKLTPQQKAQMDAMMKSRMGTPVVTKSCMTREKFNTPGFMMQGVPGVTCTQTLTTNSRTVMEGAYACTGQQTIKGSMHIEASSPTAFTATMKSTSTAQGKDTVLNLSMSGKWLGADCGDVK